MLKQTDIKYIRQPGNFVQNVNQISEKKTNKMKTEMQYPRKFSQMR